MMDAGLQPLSSVVMASDDGWTPTPADPVHYAQTSCPGLVKELMLAVMLQYSIKQTKL